MSDRFDDWIRDTAPEVPDSGEFKRLHLAYLETRLVAASRRRRRVPRPSLIAAALLLSLMVGYHGVLDSEDMSPRGLMEITLSPDLVVQAAEFGHKGVGFSQNQTPEEVQAWLMRIEGQEGEFVSFEGTLWRDMALWIKFRRIVTGEFDDIDGKPPLQPASHHDRSLLELMGSEAFSAANQAIKTNSPHESGFMEVDGVPCSYDSWTFVDPDLGEFTLVQGKPLAPLPDATTTDQN